MENYYKKDIEFLSYADTALALHSFIPKEVKAVLFYIHGAQSHAGWLFETGPLLAKAHIATYVLDRRGSGMSDGMRGDIPNAAILLSDYYGALKYVRNLHADLPLTLFGQSMGGSILLGLVCSLGFDITYDQIILSASALGKRHETAFAAEDSKTLISLNLNDIDYTDDVDYLAFMANDPLCFRQITKRSQIALTDIEALYINSQDKIHKPAAYIYPAEDPIFNPQKAIELFRDIAGNSAIIKKFETNKHYLFFTDQNHHVIKWISNFIFQGVSS